jgi:NAD(P)-dependent dehydrogenase (short-subunit alcohol dehydrogenase family)
MTEYPISAKVAIVTGGGGSVGRATAVTLAARGLTVVAVDRNDHALGELPDTVVRETADPTDPASAKGVVDRIATEVGPPDILVNTIGTFRVGDALSTTPEDLQLMVNVNLGAAFWLSQAVAPHMQRSGAGAIVHVSAKPGTEPTGGMAAYSISKAALSYLTRILDVELRPQGIRVNAVAPQLIDTPANRASVPSDVMAHAVSAQAIADVIAFLVSDAAAPVSGAILPAYGA